MCRWFHKLSMHVVTDIVVYFLLVNGGWGEWGRWSECSVTCGPGMRSRERKCDSPKPEYGGTPCNKTEKIEEEKCNKQNCPGSQTFVCILRCCFTNSLCFCWRLCVNEGKEKFDLNIGLVQSRQLTLNKSHEALTKRVVLCFSLSDRWRLGWVGSLVRVQLDLWTWNAVTWAKVRLTQTWEWWPAL